MQEKYNVTFFSQFSHCIHAIYSDTPDLLIVDINKITDKELFLIAEFKKDPAYLRIPILIITEKYLSNDFSEHLYFDDFVLTKNLQNELLIRANMAFFKKEKTIDVNPLTYLPGNITISKEIQKKLDNNEIFALAYVDMDNFKPFNDRYGFTRGDEVIRMVGRLILNLVKTKCGKEGFVGHIGGDDFVFIVDYDKVEDVGNEIINYFNYIIPTFYDEPERSLGYIESFDRQGNKNKFPIMRLSIGVAHNKFKKFYHYGAIASVASEMKKYAKAQGGGCVKIDRRKI